MRWLEPEPVVSVVAADTLCNVIALSWSAAARADSYRVFRDGDLIATLPKTALALADSAAPPLVSHMYTVAASNICGLGAPSAADAGYAKTAPSVLTFDASSYLCGAVELEWTASANAAMIRVLRDSEAIDSVSSAITTYIDSLGSIGNHAYCIVAVNECGDSPPSAPDTAEIMQFATAPQNLAFTDNHCNAITLTWTPSQGTYDLYRVYRDTSVIATAAKTDSSFADTTAVGAVDYTYMVTAFDDVCGESDSSNIVEAALSDVEPPDTPQVTLSIEGWDGVLRWDPITETAEGCPVTVTGYLVFYSDKFGGPFLYHGFTTDTSYVHVRVAQFASGMYYQVTAWSEPLSLLRQIPPEGALTREEVLEMLRLWRAAGR